VTARELIDALLAVTPMPPSEVPVDELIAAFTGVASRRQAILDAVREVAPVTSDDDRAARDELMARQDAWHTALATAREAVGQQRVGTQRLRKYAGPSEG